MFLSAIIAPYICLFLVYQGSKVYYSIPPTAGIHLTRELPLARGHSGDEPEKVGPGWSGSLSSSSSHRDVGAMLDAGSVSSRRRSAKDVTSPKVGEKRRRVVSSSEAVGEDRRPKSAGQERLDDQRRPAVVEEGAPESGQG